MNSQNKDIELDVSVVALCYNEEKDLPGFLANVMPWAKEVIIVDDLSTDNSKEIAQNAGYKVKFISHKRTSEHGFAGQRNVGIEAAQAKWVLNMDIDERVTPALLNEMSDAIERNTHNAYKYRRKNYFLHRPMQKGGWDSWNQPQFALRNKHRYKNIVHEKNVIEGAPASIGQFDNFMLHFNDEGYDERMRKSVQYCSIDAEKLLAEGKKVSAISLFISPIITFIKNYILKRGFVDGVPGLISAMHSAGAKFRTLALVWDKQNTISRSELEAQVEKLWKKD